MVSFAVGTADGVVAGFAGRGPFLRGPGHMLVGPHDRGVDRDGSVEILVRVGPGHQSGENPLPRTVDGPHP